MTQLPKVETNYEEEGRLLLSDPVVDHPVYLPRRTDVITQSAYLLAESVFEFTNADCTIINAGLIVKALKQIKLQSMIYIKCFHIRLTWCALD